MASVCRRGLSNSYAWRQLKIVVDPLGYVAVAIDYKDNVTVTVTY